MDNLWQSPNCFCHVCRKKNEKNKHFPSTCSPQLCHQSHFLKVTWIQLPMTHYYISLFFLSYHCLLIFFCFLCKGEGRDPVSNKPQPVHLRVVPDLWRFPQTPSLPLNEQHYNLTTTSLQPYNTSCHSTVPPSFHAIFL